MNGIMQMLMQRFMQGRLNNMPEMGQISQMLAGKSQPQQLETLRNFARSYGIDPDEKRFTEQEVRQFMSMFGGNSPGTADFPRKG